MRERAEKYPAFEREFGHLEGDTFVGKNHKSAVITLVERLSKAIITLQTNGRIEASISSWIATFPKHRFKSITFDCSKEFSNWRSLSNEHDMDIFLSGMSGSACVALTSIQIDSYGEMAYPNKWILLVSLKKPCQP